MAIISVSEVKAFLGITDSSKDDMITLLIPEVEAFVKGYCNDTMTDADGNASYPAGIKRPVSELLRYDLFYRATGVGLDSEKLGDYSANFTNEVESGYPIKALHLLSSFVRLSKVNFV